MVFLAVALLLGCDRPEPEPGVKVASAGPIVLSGPTEFTMSQRTTVPLPGSAGKIVATIGDITRGQVLTAVAWESGKPIAAGRSMRQGQELTFTVEEHAYTLKLKTLMNVLIGEDTAVFVLSPGGEGQDGTDAERRKIEALISALEGLEGAEFIRNGKGHSLQEAIEHLHKKWRHADSRIRTAEEFIIHAGSKSSLSGEEYRIRLADGTEKTTAEWFREQLKKMEK